MRSVGVVCRKRAGVPPQSEKLWVYLYDLDEPLKLTARKGEEGANVPDVEGYFFPLGEMLKRVEGPVFVLVTGADLEAVLPLLDEAAPPPLTYEYGQKAPVLIVDAPADKVSAWAGIYKRCSFVPSCDFNTQKAAQVFGRWEGSEPLPDMKLGSRPV